MNRAAFFTLCALAAALAALLCVAVAVAGEPLGPDPTPTPPPAAQAEMGQPALVDVSPSGLQSLWWYTTPSITAVAEPCDEEQPRRDFEARRGVLSAWCINAGDQATWTYLVEGEVRLVVWRANVTLEDTRHRTYLPLVAVCGRARR